MFDPAIKILVIDDMSTMRNLVKKRLKEMGYVNFEEAEDGLKAWAKLNEQTDIGLVVSDWNMPNCTGLELLKKVRTDSRLKQMPFILLTAEAEVSQVKQAVLAGVDSYCIKPFTMESLKSKLEQVYAKRVEKPK